MKKAEREELVIIESVLRLASDALVKSPIERGVALGAVLDSIEAIESLLADKKEA